MCSDSGADQLSDVLCIALGVSRCLYHYTTCRTMMLQKWLVCFCFVYFLVFPSRKRVKMRFLKISTLKYIY